MPTPAGFTLVTASALQNASDVLIADATAYFQPVIGGRPISFRAGGPNGGQVSSATVSTPVAGGACSIVLADTSLTYPENIEYHFTVVDSATGDLLIDEMIQPSGSSWSLDSYAPGNAAAEAPIQAVSFQIGTVTTGATGSPASVVNVGTPTEAVLDISLPIGPAGSTTPNFVAPITAPGVTVGGGFDLLSFATEEGYLSFTGDRQGRVFAAVNPDGTQIPGISGTEGAFAAGALATPLLTVGGDFDLLSFPTEEGYVQLVGDRQGRVFAGVNADGTSIVPPVVNAGKVTPFFAPQEIDPYDPAAFTAALSHVTITGQSLSTGADAKPILSTSAPFAVNKRLGPAVNAQTLGASSVTLQSLFEAEFSDDFETHGTSFAANIAALVAASILSHALVMSGSGIDGTAYSGLCGPTDWTGALVGGQNLGSPSFRELMAQVSTAMTLAPSTYAHRAVNLVHGETDALNNNANYTANLLQWQRDIQAGSNALTGRNALIPFLMTQCIFPLTGLQQLAAAMQSPLTHTLVGPEYNIPHQSPAQMAAGADNLHLTAAGQRINGAYLAKAYAMRVLRGRPWIPVVPRQFTLVRNTVVIDYYAPVAPLVLDTSLVTDPGNYGFAFSDTLGTTITAIAVTGATQLTITLSSAPSANGRTLSYANVAPGSQPLGPLSGPRGCLRDSDPALSYFAETNPVSDAVTVAAAPIALHNYGVAFSAAI